MKVKSTKTNAEFEFRTSTLFSGNGSELNGEVYMCDTWTHAYCFLNMKTKEISILAMCNGITLKGILISKNKKVQNWVEMKIKSNQKKEIDPRADF